MNGEPAATVVITTKNRKDDLRNAVASALDQDARPQVLVIDDGSEDGTSDMIRREFPAARLDRSERSLGLVVQRNRAARLVSTPIIFSIDDDAVFSTKRVISQTLGEFGEKRVGAVAMPFINIRQNQPVLNSSPDDGRIRITGTFVGTAHALRRDVFLELGGYREFFFHQGEEPDYCIRMLGGGYVVRLGRAEAIHHFESPQRDLRRMDLYGRRNDLLFAWCNVPMPWLPVQLLGTTFMGFRKGFELRRPLRMARGLAMGYGQIPRKWRQRRPVPAEIYRLFRRLGTRESFELAAIESILPIIPNIS